MSGLRTLLPDCIAKHVKTSLPTPQEHLSGSQPAPDTSLNQDPESTWLVDSKNQFWKWTRKVCKTKLLLPALFVWILKAHLLTLVLTLAHVSKSLPATRAPGLQPHIHLACLAKMKLPNQAAMPSLQKDSHHQVQQLPTKQCTSHKTRP